MSWLVTAATAQVQTQRVSFGRLGKVNKMDDMAIPDGDVPASGRLLAEHCAGRECARTRRERPSDGSVTAVHIEVGHLAHTAD